MKCYGWLQPCCVWPLIGINRNEFGLENDFPILELPQILFREFKIFKLWKPLEMVLQYPSSTKYHIWSLYARRKKAVWPFKEYVSEWCHVFNFRSIYRQSSSIACITHHRLRDKWMKPTELQIELPTDRPMHTPLLVLFAVSCSWL